VVKSSLLPARPHTPTIETTTALSGIPGLGDPIAYDPDFITSGVGLADELQDPDDQIGIPAVVSLHNVSKVFRNGNKVLDGVNLQIHQGDFIFLTGVSGAGKSTLLRLLYGAEQASSGDVIVNDVNLSRIRNRPLALLRRKLGVVFQDYRLLAHRTVSENVAFVLRAQGIAPSEIRRRLGPTLKMVGLTGKADRFPHELSGGEQQRLSLARAIVNTPILLIADEPTGNLDWENSLLVLQILQRLNSFGVTIIMTSHDPNLVERTDHRVVHLQDGQLYDLR